MRQENYNTNKRKFKQLTYTEIGKIIGKDRKLAKFIEKEIKAEKSSLEVIEYKIKQGKFSTILCFIDKEILEVKREDLTYRRYAKKEDKKGKNQKK